MTETLLETMNALQAERDRTWTAEQLAMNANQRRELTEDFDPAAAVQVGDVLPPFRLDDVEGGQIELGSLIEHGPAVLLFFRFAGCPACNLALPYYQRALWPALEQAGVPLVAISPQRADRLIEIKQRHDLGFTVATDKDNALARKLGITFEANAASRAAAATPLGEVTGTGTWELPLPTVIVVDQAGEVTFVDIAPDWMRRAEAAPILDAVERARSEATV
jgi:peroxiredoxin